jgi:hypothetical protein
MRALLLASLAALAAATIAGAATAPRSGLFIPGVSLGGVKLGMTQAQVRARWGSDYGVCRACPMPTWYYNYVKRQPQGLGVTFKDHRVDSVFTIWAPSGWHTPEGLAIGQPDVQIGALYGHVFRTDCANYAAIWFKKRKVVVVVYIAQSKVFGFGLSRVGAQLCR